MEYLDILNEQGEFLGKTKDRDQVHRDGDWHRTVHVWVINGREELLIQKRSAEKESYPGYWDISSAGHVAAGDSSVNSAIREVYEELGLFVDVSELTYLFTINNKVSLNQGLFLDNEISDVFLLRRDFDLKEISFSDKEISEVSLIELSKLKEAIFSGNPSFVPHENEYHQLFSFLSR